MLEKLFHLREKGTNVKTELVAGLVTFLSMAYILAVNPSVLAASGMSPATVFLATAIASGISCLIMGLVANYPIALSAGMGTNALMAYTVCLGMGYTWQEALAVIMLSGIVFLIISLTGLRKIIINSIPKNLKLAIGAGIGFFIAFIGLKNAGIVIANSATAVSIGALTDPQVVLALIGIILTFILVIKKVPGAVFFGLVGTALIGVIMSGMGYVSTDVANALPTLNTTFSYNWDFSGFGAFLTGFKTLFTHTNWPIVLFAFLYVDFMDTAGTLVGVGNSIGLVDEDGNMENIEKALLADSVGTVVGAACGTSTITSFIESGSGVAAGGRTGLTAITTGVLFFLSILISPILSVITSSVTTPALVVVGVMMAQQMKDIEWDKLEIAAPAFMTILMMVLGYSIADGIAFGMLVYTLTTLVAGRVKKPSVILLGLDVIFLLYFVLL